MSVCVYQTGTTTGYSFTWLGVQEWSQDLRPRASSGDCCHLTWLRFGSPSKSFPAIAMFQWLQVGSPPTEGCGKGLVLLGPGWERKRVHAWHTMLYDLLYKQWDCERNPQRQCDVIAETCVVGERIRRTSWIETSSELLRRS